MKSKHHIVAAILLALIAGTGSMARAGAPEANAAMIVPPAPPVPCADRPTTVERPCVVPRTRLMVETGYYQNASKVGSTALAGYPLTRLRVGVANRLEAVVDAPVQYAESGYAGAGLYPRSSFGFGAKWLSLRSPGVQYTLSAEASPPIERYVPNSMRSRYGVAIAAGLSLDALTALNVSLGVTSFAEHTGHRPPRLRGGFALRRSLSAGTAILSELTFRSPAAKTNAQTSAALYLQQSLSTNTLFDIGIGTAFNAAGDSKAHFLSFGFAVRPCARICP